MTTETEPQESELSKFKEEVLDQGAENCLPKNLSHYWLDKLSVQANTLLKEVQSPEGAGCAEIIAALICILFHKNGYENPIEMTLEAMFEHCQNYAIELSMEEVYRKTEVKYEAASLDTILTNRDVRVWYDE